MQEKFNLKKKLDIQEILSNQFTLTEFMRAFLTRRQKVMLALQKSRRLRFDEACSDNEFELGHNDFRDDHIERYLTNFQP